ncbi:MAG TPA: PH domain-containing protein [Candidatus Saccharimonadales bacterium]|nr:PH domain-containing protein [Candidatus Saccharimonadales bacterium]
MVTKKSIEDQLKKLDFNLLGWGRSEARELHHVILPDEEIYELVNGIYEGGFALLVATNVRVLLLDKKPLNYLSVEDIRFDMISEIDYGHRLIGARISISTGSKNLQFTSFNQPRLRKLITHVQHCMAETKQRAAEHQQDQKQHLEEINKQLQIYLKAQEAQQQTLRQQLEVARMNGGQVPAAAPVRPSNELSDYLFAQSLLQQYQQASGQPVAEQLPALDLPVASVPAPIDPQGAVTRDDLKDMYEAGYQEVFGKTHAPASSTLASVPAEPNPLQVAYSKLPLAMRNVKFGRPSFHAHSQASVAESS